MLEKIKSASRNVYFSVPVVIVGLLIVLIFQYLHGAKIVYFLPDYPITRDYGTTFSSDDLDSTSPYGGFDKCEWYGSCFHLANETETRAAPLILLLIISYYALLSGLAERFSKKCIGIFFVGVSYFLIGMAQSLNWFFSCSEFCGMEYFVYWILPVSLFLIGVIVSFVIKRRNNKAK